MKRILLVLSVALVMVAMLVATAVPALAQVEPNRGNPPSEVSDNCIGYISSDFIRNGQGATLGTEAAHGAKGDQIKAVQGTCGAQQP